MKRICLIIMCLVLLSTGCSEQKSTTLNIYYMIGGYFRKEETAEINAYLKKINSGYQINFVNMINTIPYDNETENIVYTSMSQRILEYLKEAREQHLEIDILNANQLGSMDFSRTYLVDEGLLTELDPYFKNTESGKIVYNAYPEIIFDSQKIDGKSYFVPGSLFDLVETKSSCFDKVAYMAIKKDYLDQAQFDQPLGYNLSQYNDFLRKIGMQDETQLLFYNSFRIMNNFPGLTPVCGSSLRVSPFVIDEKTQTVKILYECEDWLDSLNTFQGIFQDDYYVYDSDYIDMNAVVWYDYVNDEEENDRIYIAENYNYINVIPYWGLAIPSWCDKKDEVMDFFGLLYSDPELSRLFFPDALNPGEKMFFGYGNPYIVEGSTLPKDLTKENHQKFYESLNKSCAYGFTFDFSEYFDEMQDLVVKHNEYYTFYNDTSFIDMEKYKEVMKDTRIEEIRDDLNAQLQRYLKGD
ncbi:hypothetical protein DWY25_08155 [Holdemania filiformis]|uniref:Extracellular solute-binding protein n=1 Tax=Holdemania filiformis TaxID=61171 RepID=A0A412G2T3_9FIRM|nr:hypothetical protein [Holdemania filiformis]RGR74743.1 hypothetical protein DWY25_08155 [Holdemania filiformis]